MAILNTYSPEWQDYYVYNKTPFRDTHIGGVRDEYAVPIGLNPKCRAAEWDLTGFAIKPRRFNNKASTIPLHMPGPTNPLDSLQDLNYYNNAFWNAYAITPRHAVVCHHYINAPSVSSPNLVNNVNAGHEQQDLGPWPPEANQPNTLVFMNAEGEYFVHSYTTEPKVDGMIPKSAELGGHPGDAVLLVLDEPIPADSGIKIYDRNAVVDMDQQFALMAEWDPQSRLRFTSYAGFSSFIDMHVDTRQFWYTGSNNPGIPNMVEERKLPGGNLENEPIEFASTGDSSASASQPRADDAARTWQGDSGTPYLIHSKSKGTMPACGPGGARSCCDWGPWAKERVEAFQAYLETFNAENGTDYTFGYEVITDAITDIMVPPMINPLVCKTQEGMKSRKLVCEVTATGANGEVITKRSDSILEQGITEKPVLANTPFRYFTAPFSQETPFSGGIESLGLIRDNPFAQWVGVNIDELNMDPMCPFSNGTIAIRSSDPSKNIFVSMPRSKSHPWQPLTVASAAAGGGDFHPTEEFFIPEDWPLGDVTVELFLSTRNGTVTFSQTVELTESIPPRLIDAEYFSPDQDPNFPTGKVRVEIEGTPYPTYNFGLWLRGADEPAGGNIIAAFVNTEGGQAVEVGETFIDIPIAYGTSEGVPIPCVPHFADSLFLEGSLTNSAGAYFISQTFSNGQPEDEPARLLTTIGQGDCDGDLPADALGACCFGNACASDTTQEFCENSGGVWNQATSCDDSPCQESFVEETGACCLRDGSCQENVTQSFCEDLMSGEWQGSETTCNGAGCGGEAEEAGSGFGSGGLGD